MEEDLSIDKVGPWNPFANDFDLLGRMDRAGWQIWGMGGFGELGREIIAAITRKETAPFIDPAKIVEELWPDQNGQPPARYTVGINKVTGLLMIGFVGSEEDSEYTFFLKKVIGFGLRINDEHRTISEENRQQ